MKVIFCLFLIIILTSFLKEKANHIYHLGKYSDYIERCLFKKLNVSVIAICCFKRKFNQMHHESHISIINIYINHLFLILLPFQSLTS